MIFIVHRHLNLMKLPEGADAFGACASASHAKYAADNEQEWEHQAEAVVVAVEWQL